MTYYSSPLTFIFKYIFPFVMLAAGIIGFFTLKTIGDELTSNFANAFGIAILWISIFMVQMPFRIKSVEVNEHELTIKSSNGHQKIPHSRIASVSVFDLTNPWMITVKYLDPNKNEFRKISYMPNPAYQRILALDEMTTFLKQKAKSENPNYEESSMVKNLAISFLAALPFLIGMIYFMSKAGLNIF